MTPNQFQQQCLRTEMTPDFIKSDFSPPPADRTTARLLHGMIGICTEAGELQDMMKRHLFYGKALDHTNVMEECFDVLWYIALCLDASGYTLEQAMERGIAKLRARYPAGFTAEAALCRDTVQERTVLEQT
jgi:NTP pyrophosphatase (non-canonical NTP hydrolase)